MKHIEEIRDYWNRRANGFSLAVDEELTGGVRADWEAFFREHLPEAPAEILDVGTGAGFFPAILAGQGYRVTAIDYSDDMVAKAVARLKDVQPPVEVLQMDAQALAFPTKHFDALVSRNVIWNLDAPEKAYREMFRVLRPGGVAVIDDGNMYLYHHDEEYAALREERMRQMQKEGQNANRDGLHGKHNVDGVDFSVIEEIARDLPMSRTRRPQWDFETLIRVGFRDIRIIIRGEPLPMGFRIVAKKPSV